MVDGNDRGIKKIHMIFIARIVFAIVILFELLNGFGVLRVPLDFSWFGLIVTSGVAWASIELLFGKAGNEKKLRIALPIAAMAVLLDMAGDVFRLYSRIMWYDKALHVIGGAAVAYLVYLLVERALSALRPNMQVLFVVGITSLLGTAYEVEEWLEDAWVHGQMLRLGNGPDVADDMLMNIVGAGIVMAIVLLYEARKKKHEK